MKKIRITSLLTTTIISFLACYEVFAQISVSGSLTREYAVSPGETIRGTIIIQNSQKTAAKAKIYLKDYMFYCDGKSDYDEPGTVKRSNGLWVRFNPTYATVPAREKVVINHLIKIPNKRTLKGTYWSVLMVEEMPDISPRSNKRSVGINSIMRYGIQLITHIGETGIRELKFIDSRIADEDGKLILEVDLKNTGQRMLRPMVWVELYDTNGKKVDRFEGKKKRTYPKTTIRQKVELGILSRGSYSALVVADCGGDDVFGITYNLKN